MSRKLLIAALPAVLGLLALASADTPVAPVAIERLTGSWEGEGELFGRPAAFSMSWSPVLAGRFVELRFENRLVLEDGSEQTVLQSVAFYRVDADGGLSGSWFDTRGQTISLSATTGPSEVSTLWTGDTEEGRTTYAIIDDDSVEVFDEVRSGDERRPFGRATYRRVSAARR